MRRSGAGTRPEPGLFAGHLPGTPSVLSRATHLALFSPSDEGAITVVLIREKTGWLALAAVNSRPHGSLMAAVCVSLSTPLGSLPFSGLGPFSSCLATLKNK